MTLDDLNGSTATAGGQEITTHQPTGDVPQIEIVLSVESAHWEAAKGSPADAAVFVQWLSDTLGL